MANNDLQIKEANVIGTTIVSDTTGNDPELGITGLVPNTLYFRICAEDGQYNYIHAGAISASIKNINTTVSAKASITDVNLLKTELTEKDNIITNKLSDIQTKLNDKVDKDEYDECCKDECVTKSYIDDLENDIINKVNISDFDEFKNDVIESLTGDDSIVSSLTAKVDSHGKDISTIKSDILKLYKLSNELSDDSVISSINEQIKLLKIKLAEKLSQNDLSPINDKLNTLSKGVETVNSRLNYVNNTLTNKASTGYVDIQIDNVNDSINTIQNELHTKIGIEQLSSKASKTELSALSDKINKLSAECTGDIKSLENDYKTLKSTVNAKADNKEIKNEIASINTELSNKVDLTTFGKKTSNLDHRVTRIETDGKRILTDMRCELNNVKTDIDATHKQFTGITDSHSSKLNSIDAQIKSLNDKDKEFSSILKNEWIRILTPDEYNLLPTKPNYDDGTKNPNALQPNVIYLTMKYNKPYELYIGSILIAKAEDKIGSSGFAYSFPIVF